MHVAEVFERSGFDVSHLGCIVRYVSDFFALEGIVERIEDLCHSVERAARANHQLGSPPITHNEGPGDCKGGGGADRRRHGIFAFGRRLRHDNLGLGSRVKGYVTSLSRCSLVLQRIAIGRRGVCGFLST